MPEGLDKQWSKNGKLEFKTIWKRGSNEGVSEEYYESGQLNPKEKVYMKYKKITRVIKKLVFGRNIMNKAS